MKKLYPTDNKPNTAISGNDPNSKPITEQQYIDLVNKVNQAECDVEQVQDALDTHIANQASSVTTGDLTATNVNACHLIGTTTNTCSLNADTATIGTATIDTIASDNITVDCKVVADEVDATTVTADNATVTCATIDNLTTCNFNPDSVCTCSITTNSISTEYIGSCTTESCCVCADEVCSVISLAEELYGCCASLNCASIHNAIADNASIACIDNKYITHKHTPQHIHALEEFWIVLPKFTNGEYFLEARNDTDAKLWSMEVDNSQANIRFKWSNNVRAYIKDVEIISDIDTEFLQIHVVTFGEEVTLYSQSISLENTLPPSIYGSKQYDTGKDFDITALAGTYMPNTVFVGTFHADSIEIDETHFKDLYVQDNINLSCSKDQYGETVNFTSGNEGDYITIKNDGVYCYPTWVSKASCIERGNTHLVDSDTVSCYNGELITCDDPLTKEYPITHLGNNTCVHGNVNVQCGVCNPHLFIGLTCDYENATLADNAEVVLTDEANPKLYRRQIIDNEVELKELAAQEANLEDGKPVVYQATSNTLDTTDALDIDALTVNTLNADKAFIKELDTVKEETISSTGNYIALRANNDSAMVSGETAGILVNNYNGNGKMSAVVADNNGIVRVGTGTPTNTTYPTLYFKKSDSKYYTDITDPTTEVTPAGALTRWDDVEDTETYTKWTNAVFSVVDFSNTTTTNYVKVGNVYYDYNIVEATPTGTETGGHYIDAVYGIADYDEYTTGVVKSYNDKLYVLLTKSNADKTVVEVTGVEDEDFAGIVTLDDDLYEEIYDNGTTLLDAGPFNLGTLTTFSVTESTLEPLTTRADAIDMNDQGITKWNNTGKKIDTIATPTASEQILTANVTNGEVSYQWSNKPSGVYHFASIACYEAYTGNIPENSIVVIDEEDNHLMGDNQ